MASIKQLFEKINDLQQRKAIWTHVIDVLGEFVDDDSGPSKKSIPVPDSITGVASQDSLVATIEELMDEKVQPLDAEVSKLQGINVKVKL